MSITRSYTRINWKNDPSNETPLNDVNLNHEDAALYDLDGKIVLLDTIKANQEDLLTCIDGYTYDETTGILTFYFKNGTTGTIDFNVEKIPVLFSMSAAGVITMTTADGTEYTADVGSLIKTYSFENTGEISWTVTVDASGNQTVRAYLVDGGIAESKLQVNFLADCRAAKGDAEQAAAGATAEALEAEGWAVGTQNGVPVQAGSKYFENYAKYYAEQAGTKTLSSLTDVSISGATEGQALVYNGQTWENGSVTPTTVSGTLQAGATTVTFTSPKITQTSLLRIYAENVILAPKAVTVSAGSATYTFKAQSSNVKLKLEIVEG